jgi:hypothetical protein
VVIFYLAAWIENQGLSINDDTITLACYLISKYILSDEINKYVEMGNGMSL